MVNIDKDGSQHGKKAASRSLGPPLTFVPTTTTDASNAYTCMLNKEQKAFVEMHLRKCDSIEDLWMRGNKDDAWTSFKEVFNKQYSDKQDERCHFEAFAAGIKDIIEYKRTCRDRGLPPPTVGLTYMADRPLGSYI